jgi:salicylate hydroxylase
VRRQWECAAGPPAGTATIISACGVLWLVADDPGFAAERRIFQVVDGAHTMLGFLPTGLAPGRDRPAVSLFWSLRADRVAAWRKAGLAQWRDRVLALGPLAEPILDPLSSAFCDPPSHQGVRHRDGSHRRRVS